VGVVTVALVTLPRLAVAAFIDDPAVLLDAVPYLLLVGISQPFMAFEVVLLGSFAGAQRTTPPAVLEISLTTARIPLAAGLVAAGFGIEGVWIAIALTTVLKGSVLAALFARWQHRFVRPGRVIAA
jgi:Na+-driven multidrug efflux pump